MIYSPWSYASGSIFAVHTAQIATMFWKKDRPDIAWSTWISLIPWNTLDSLGHTHEVLAGNYYRPQAESVPEQTWSSAGLLDSAARGLLGLTIEGTRNSITFRPHLPAEWDHISVANIHLPHSTLTLTMRQTMSSIDLDANDVGAPFALSFQPRMPLGAHLIEAKCDGHSVPAQVQRTGEDEHAQLLARIVTGTSHCHLRFAGGVLLILPPEVPGYGNRSRAMKLTEVTLHDRTLLLRMDVRPTITNRFELRTPWKIKAVSGAAVQALPDGSYKLAIEAPRATGSGYIPASIQITFAEK